MNKIKNIPVAVQKYADSRYKNTDVRFMTYTNEDRYYVIQIPTAIGGWKSKEIGTLDWFEKVTNY